MTKQNSIFTAPIAYLFCLLFLSACGGGGGSNTSDTAPVTAADPTLIFSVIKTFRFSWTDVSDATHYKLLENSDGASGFVQVGSDITQGTQSFDHIVPLHTRLNAQYMLQSCNDVGCTDSSSVSVSGNLVDAIGYVKASNSEMGDGFGRRLSISGDGQTLAVGVTGEESNATGINGDQSDNSAAVSGAVYVFIRNANSWSQEAYIKSSNSEELDRFGSSVSLSSDGNILAVGAIWEDSNATGINGDEDNALLIDSGAVYVFSRSANSWSQQAYVKASNTGASDFFGISIALSGDGNTLAVGASSESSNASGINGDEGNDLLGASGAVYLFSRSAGNWSQQAYIKASDGWFSDQFGVAVSLSGEGNTLAVGAFGEDSSVTGINGVAGDSAADDSGAAYVFVRSGSDWSQQAYIKASNTGAADFFGGSVDLSESGSTLVIGAQREDSNSNGIDGDQDDDIASDSDTGAVYVFSRSGTDWSQQAYIKASNTGAGDQFGSIVSLSNDGDILAVAANKEDSSAIGLNGDQSNDSAVDDDSGAVYLFTKSGGSWSQQAYIKASNTEAGDRFGVSVSLAGNSETLAIGAHKEDSAASGLSGDSSDNSADSSGAVYLY